MDGDERDPDRLRARVAYMPTARGPKPLPLDTTIDFKARGEIDRARWPAPKQKPQRRPIIRRRGCD